MNPELECVRAFRACSTAKVLSIERPTTAHDFGGDEEGASRCRADVQDEQATIANNGSDPSFLIMGILKFEFMGFGACCTW